MSSTAQNERLRLAITTLGGLTALYIVFIVAWSAWANAKLATQGQAVAFSLPGGGRQFGFQCDSRTQDVRLDVYTMAASEEICTQLCLPNAARYLAQAARIGWTFGGNCGQHGCTTPEGPMSGPATYVNGLQQFSFRCANSTEEEEVPEAGREKRKRLTSCANFGALTTDELTNAARRDGSGWACTQSGHSCYNIGIPRSRGCPAGFTWLGQSCYKPCPPDYERMSLCTCRASEWSMHSANQHHH